jgi:hypothetical protein
VTAEYLFVTRCSRGKKRGRKAKPKELYRSKIPQFFFRKMEELGFRYGVLSDKYGLHLDDEILEPYDIHPSVLESKRKKYLGDLVRRKTLSIGKEKIIFYNNSPLRSFPYFEILSYSGLPSFFCTKINSVVGPGRRLVP